MSRLRKYLKGFAQGTAITAVIVGLSAWTVYGLKGITNAHKRGEREKIERIERSHFLAKKTLGVLVDSSIHGEPFFDFVYAFDKAIKKNNEAFSTAYDVEFRYVDVKNANIKYENMYSVIPKDWSKDYTLFVTNATLVGPVIVNKKLTDYSKYGGWCFYGPYNFMLVHKFKTYHSEAWVPNLIAHEMGHCQGRSGHHTDRKCIMYPTVYPDQKFCKETIETVRRKNGLL